MKTLANLVDGVELKLGDTSNTIWAAATQVQPAVLEAGDFVSGFVPAEGPPYVWLTASNKSREVSCVRPYVLRENWASAAYPVLLRDTDGDLLDDSNIFHKRRNISWGFNSFTLNLGSAPTAGETDTLTGTVTFTASSVAVTGSGTAFTTELRVGYYICKNAEWYRVAAIASDTALTLGRYVVTADDGASASTKYWRSDVVLDAPRRHLISEQTDLAGAIDAGVAAGYADGVWMIHVDALGSGTIEAGMLFTIAGTEGTYRVVSDVTITTNEADIYIEPCLKDRAAENAVVTFYPSTLNDDLENIVEDVAAANLLIHWDGSSVSGGSSGRVAVKDSFTLLDLYNTETDKALAEITSSKTSLSDGNSTINTVSVGRGLQDYLAKMSANLQHMAAYIQEAKPYMGEAQVRLTVNNVIQAHRNMGEVMLQSARQKLKAMAQPRTIHQYPRY